MQKRRRLKWPASEIKRRIEDAGSTQSAIARACGVQPNAVHYVIHGNAVSAKIEAEIARVIGEESIREEKPNVENQ